MATSSSGRSTLIQWHRFITVIKESISHQSSKLKNSATSLTAKAEQTLDKTSLAPPTAAEFSTDGTLRAIAIYLQQLNGSATNEGACKKKQHSTDSDCHGSGNLSTDSSVCLQSKHVSTNYDVLEKAMNIRQIASAPLTRVASPVPHDHISGTVTPIARSVSPSSLLRDTNRKLVAVNSILSNQENTSVNGKLSVLAPTYSTIRISVPHTYKSEHHLDFPKGSIALNNAAKHTSTPVITVKNTAVVTTSTAVLEQQESEIQKALRTVNSYIPTSLSFSQVNLNFLRSPMNSSSSPNLTDKNEHSRPKWLDEKKDLISKPSIDARTRYLIRGVTCDSDVIALRRLRDLCHHLTIFPHTKGAAVKCGGVGRTLRVLRNTQDEYVARQARAAMGLMGYPGVLPANGARLLTIDGGGVRGLVALELLRKLETVTGKPIHELFDFICGVSTGALLAVLVGVRRLPLDECSRLYYELSEQVFRQTTLRGATGLVMNKSYYDSKAWDAILQRNMGDTPLLDTASERGMPKLCLVASHAERSVTQAYLFRNYFMPYRVASRYTGTTHAQLWQAVRASAAAPGYFSEFQLGDKLLLDGGILVNNPTAIAVHEARQLWPDNGFQCVVSLGTGRCQPIEPAVEKASSFINWGNKIRSVINSATDTEGVHTILHDLLPGHVYFRFNPYLSEEFSLDETRPERIATLIEDTRLYARKNTQLFEQAAAALLKKKTPYYKARDYVKESYLLHGFDVVSV